MIQSLGRLPSFIRDTSGSVGFDAVAGRYLRRFDRQQDHRNDFHKIDGLFASC